jgi:chromosome segregation ATPase
MKNEQLSNQIYKNKLPIRVDKTLAWLADSRDSWKEKCMQTKLQLKRQTLAIKRLKNGRTSWKLYSTRLKQELIQSKKMMSCLQEQVDEMEAQIENYKKEIQVVKKSINLPCRLEV